MAPQLACAVVLENYFRAKDGNRPHLARRVFAPNATLEVRDASGAMTLPALTSGATAIADVLVRRFNQRFENIYSFYLSRPEIDRDRFDCAWLVGLSDKADGSVRVGCGRYAWDFGAAPARLVTRLEIAIQAMQILPPAALEPVLDWLLGLDYPWTSADAVRAGAPALESLAPVLERITKSPPAG